MCLQWRFLSSTRSMTSWPMSFKSQVITLTFLPKIASRIYLVGEHFVKKSFMLKKNLMFYWYVCSAWRFPLRMRSTTSWIPRSWSIRRVRRPTPTSRPTWQPRPSTTHVDHMAPAHPPTTTRCLPNTTRTTTITSGFKINGGTSKHQPRIKGEVLFR